MPPHLVAPFRPFVERLTPGRPAAVLCHNDADGLAAGAILARALGQIGHAAVAETTLKGESGWSPEVAARLSLHAPQALFVCDLGSRPGAILNAPTLLIDHHRPDGLPPGATLITGYGAEPAPTSGLLAYHCAATVADARDLDWLAAVSLIADLGDKAPFELLAAAKKRHTAARLKEAAALLNAPRRASSGDARPALRLLLRADGPRDITHGTSPEAETMRAAKEEVAGELARAKKIAPRVKNGVALIRAHSACQVHPVLAATWRMRLKGNVVIAANSGFLPGRVNFSVRSADDTDLIAWLRRRAPAGAGDWFARGHDRATGGSLEFPAWNEFVRGLGFGPEAEVAA